MKISIEYSFEKNDNAIQNKKHPNTVFEVCGVHFVFNLMLGVL